MDPTGSIQWVASQDNSLVPVIITTVNDQQYIIYGQPLSQLPQEQQDILNPPQKIKKLKK